MSLTAEQVYEIAPLASRHEVEIASVCRHIARPRLPIDPRVTLTPLTELRSDGRPWTEPESRRLLRAALAVSPRQDRTSSMHGSGAGTRPWTAALPAT